MVMWIFFYILGASSNIFFFPFLLVFLLSFVSDWLLFYVEDTAIVLPRRAEVFSCRVVGWVVDVVGYRRGRYLSFPFSDVAQTLPSPPHVLLLLPFLPLFSAFLFSFILSISSPVLLSSSLCPLLSPSVYLSSSHPSTHLTPAFSSQSAHWNIRVCMCVWNSPEWVHSGLALG